MNDFIGIGYRTVIVLFLLFLIAKMLGKKQISQLSLFDYIVGITIGSIAADISLDLEKDLIEIDFYDDATIKVTKNEIYVSIWGPLCIPVDFLPLWNIDMYDNIDNYDYIQLRNNDNNYWYRIVKRLVEKCNYTMQRYYTKEKVLNEIEKYLN